MKFFTEAEIVRWYGSRCSEFDPGCAVCAAWTRHELLQRMLWEDTDNRASFIYAEENLPKRWER